MLTGDEERYCRDMYLDRIYDSVRKIEMFTPAETDAMVQEIKDSVESNKLSWTEKRHDQYATRDIQIVYHSSYTGEERLQKHAPLTSQNASDALNSKMMNEYRDMFALSDDFPISYDEAFVVHYSPDKQKSLNVHTDGSPLSFVCALNDDFEGGGTHFPYLDTSCIPKKGECCLFSGQQHHEGLETLNGERYILTGFINHGPPLRVCGKHFMEHDNTEMQDEWLAKQAVIEKLSGDDMPY